MRPFFEQHIDELCTISSKTNGTSKGVRFSEELYHYEMKFDRSNKFDISYYGLVISQWLKIECIFGMGK